MLIAQIQIGHTNFQAAGQNGIVLGDFDFEWFADREKMFGEHQASSERRPIACTSAGHRPILEQADIAGNAGPTMFHLSQGRYYRGGL